MTRAFITPLTMGLYSRATKLLLIISPHKLIKHYSNYIYNTNYKIISSSSNRKINTKVRIISMTNGTQFWVRGIQILLQRDRKGHKLKCTGVSPEWVCREPY